CCSGITECNVEIIRKNSNTIGDLSPFFSLFEKVNAEQYCSHGKSASIIGVCVNSPEPSPLESCDHQLAAGSIPHCMVQLKHKIYTCRCRNDAVNDQDMGQHCKFFLISPGVPAGIAHIQQKKQQSGPDQPFKVRSKSPVPVI